MKEKVFSIHEAKDFDKLRNIDEYDTAYVVLAENVDMSTYGTFEPINASNKNICIRGCNHQISNLKINKPGETNVGLFSNINDLFILNCDFGNCHVIGGQVVGALAGKATGSVTITNSDFDIHVEGEGLVGGLVGASKNVEISKLSIDGEVKGLDIVGGIAAMCDSYSVSLSSINARISAYGKCSHKEVSYCSSRKEEQERVLELSFYSTKGQEKLNSLSNNLIYKLSK